MKKSLVKRNRTKILRDTARVITRSHIPSAERLPLIIERVLSLPEEQATLLLQQVYENFSDRHKNIETILQHNFEKIVHYIPRDLEFSRTKELLLGAYFTMEYSVESAALFNPSIVPHPNQKDVPPGSLRFIMSLRATGEGHISSIVFRSGLIQEDGSILLNPASEFVGTPKIRHDQSYDRHLFRRKLKDMKAWNETSIRIFDKLPEQFTFKRLVHEIVDFQTSSEPNKDETALRIIRWLADSNYFIEFDGKNEISERVIFPVSENESKGIEDARFVQFFDEDGEVTYFATYTAYNGICILPQLLVTKDFINFDIMTLNGKAVQNKGMALFPRKINGQYAMLSRQDGVNNYLMYSDNVHFWDEAQLLQEPQRPWEFIQVGNCGSPIEIEEGWLVLTHGVGPMRQYCIGAMLLDLNDPSKIIARLEEPLITPNEEEREGYVPNVVYSCGSLINNNKLILPYAMSDITSGIATVDMSELLGAMR